MSQDQWEAKVTPAQLSFVCIYNPALGTTDETFHDQVVFYHSRKATETRATSKTNSKASALKHEAELKEEENAKLRQVGLAQGMVNFARSFSNGKAVDSVETEKSRIVLHELESGWWILASVDLTRLPGASTASHKDAKQAESFEYSAREVSPPALLLQQLITAHRIFLLHHGRSLEEIYNKSNRDKFCALLDRYWSRFCLDWEVLLHGNPAVEVFGGLKLSSGGELGIGVGEEEWGSGEREVLEDLVRNTEGLVDLTVARFGEAAPAEDNASLAPSGDTTDRRSATPWLGSGHLPEAHDGIVFGGVGAITRPSLRAISAWVQQVYTYGENAYGIRDNPQRQRRKRRKRDVPGEELADKVDSPSDGGGLRKKTQKAEAWRQEDLSDDATSDVIKLPHDPRPKVYDRVASHDHATGTASPQIASQPSIPPPIVLAAEQALDKATSNAAQRKSQSESEESHESPSTYGISDKWMKYLTFGLSSGTATSQTKTTRPSHPRQSSTTNSAKLKRINSEEDAGQVVKDPAVDHVTLPARMRNLDPVPEGHAAAAQVSQQVWQENKGYFIIGFTGDLEFSASADPTDRVPDESDGGERNMLRTLQVERIHNDSSSDEENHNLSRQDSNTTLVKPDLRFERLRILMYVRRPFITIFLFEQQTVSLQNSELYRGLHLHITPLYKPLLASTSLENVAARIADSHVSVPECNPSIDSRQPPSDPSTTSPVFDLVYDPRRLTVHTSIPNIPLPGTMLAEGIATTSSGTAAPPPWTRIEALNVHSQILNTLANTKDLPRETERTSKTTRGWWIVWMRLPYAMSNVDSDAAAHGNKTDFIHDVGDARVAFLVRRASDWVGQKGTGSRVSSGMFGLVRSEDTTAAKGAGSWEGIGIDARKYVEGLLSLNR